MMKEMYFLFFFFSSRRRHTRCGRDWSSDVCSSDLKKGKNQEIKEKKLKKLERPERGIDTLFRVTLRNHTQLSAIADSKANILLSVNSIIISIILTAIIPKLDSPSNSHLIIDRKSVV